ncbi:hypothetical protein ACFQ9X_37530 [Catenulispora yoronensis]
MSPQAINNLGQVVGYGQTAGEVTHSFLWQYGQMTDLGSQCYATGINDNGVISGYYSNGLIHACLLDHGSFVDIGALLPDTRSTAAGINKYGQVVINTKPVDNPASGGPAVWQNGTVVHLPIPAGLTAVRATGINDLGQVTGYGVDATGFHPCCGTTARPPTSAPEASRPRPTPPAWPSTTRARSRPPS